MPMTSKIPDIAPASISETLKALDVNPEIGLTHVEVDNRRKEHGYNELAEQKYSVSHATNKTSFRCPD